MGNTWDKDKNSAWNGTAPERLWLGWRPCRDVVSKSPLLADGLLLKASWEVQF